MINLLVTAIVTVGVALCKGALSIVGFLLKMIGRLFRLLLSVLPLTCAALVAVCAYLLYYSFTGKDPLPEALLYHPDGRPFLQSFGALILLIGDLRGAVPGILRVLILIASVILGLPVLLALLLSHAGIALLPVLPVLLIAELAVYLLYGLLARKTPPAQIRDRYFALFPKSANRHYERNYHAWLKRHAGEFADDTFGRMPEDRYRGERRPRSDEWEDGDADPDGTWEPYARAAHRRSGRARLRAEREARRQRRIEAYYDDYDEETYAEEDGYEEEAYAEEDGYEEEAYAEGSRYDEEDAGGEAERYADDARQRRRGGGRRARFFDFDGGEDSAGDSGAKASRAAFDFFAGCRDLASVERKYRSLVKIYHPDNQDGDTSAIQEINAQYAEAKRRFR